jgi:hypothetical protein
MSAPVRDKDRAAPASAEGASTRMRGEREALDLIKSALAGLKFGELVISVHEGEVVQISRTEKLRPPR